MQTWGERGSCREEKLLVWYFFDLECPSVFERKNVPTLSFYGNMNVNFQFLFLF